MLGSNPPKRTKLRKVEDSERARSSLAEEEESMIDWTRYTPIHQKAEQDGSVFHWTR
jgi:hypothetical protein